MTSSKTPPLIELNGIRLAACNVQSAEPELGEFMVRLTMNRNSQVVSLEEGGQFLVATEFQLALSHEERLDAVFLQVIARFHMAYQLPPDSTLKAREDLLPFAESTAMFQVWPYWRELASAMVARMGYPRVEIPVMALGRDLSQEGWRPVAQVATGTAAKA